MAQLPKLNSSIGVTYNYILIIILYELIALLINKNTLFYLKYFVLLLLGLLCVSSSQVVQLDVRLLASEGSSSLWVMA